MSYSEPASVSLGAVGLSPLAVISAGRLSLRIADPRAATGRAPARAHARAATHARA